MSVIRLSVRFILPLLLAGCAATPPLPAGESNYCLPRLLHVVDQSNGQDSVLAVQREGKAMRWSWLNPLGAPLARQVLEQGRWRDDGLTPPNASAIPLFAALIFAWTPRTALDANYGADAWHEMSTPHGWRRTLLAPSQALWTVESYDEKLIIAAPNGKQWHISPLSPLP